jgi:hypothetical protein
MLKKTKIIAIIGTVLAIPLVFIAFIFFLLIKDSNIILDYEDVVYFDTEEVFKNNRKYLLVSGQYFGSALKIRKVKEKFDNGDITVAVYTTLFSENDSSFLYPVQLDDSINRVLFGEEKKVIWERN